MSLIYMYKCTEHANMHITHTNMTKVNENLISELVKFQKKSWSVLIRLVLWINLPTEIPIELLSHYFYSFGLCNSKINWQ